MPDSSRLTGGDAPAPARRHRKLGIVLGLLAIILIAAVFGLPRLLDLNRYRGAIAAEIEKATGGKAALGRISWGIATGLWVEADGLSIARAPRLSRSISPSPASPSGSRCARCSRRRSS